MTKEPEEVAQTKDDAGMRGLYVQLPIGEYRRLTAYAKDKGVANKRIIMRALELYFDKVATVEGDKYIIEPTDNRDIL